MLAGEMPSGDMTGKASGTLGEIDLPLNFHPAATSASAGPSRIFIQSRSTYE
jgi:hypothetical protein